MERGAVMCWAVREGRIDKSRLSRDLNEIRNQTMRWSRCNRFHVGQLASSEDSLYPGSLGQVKMLFERVGGIAVGRQHLDIPLPAFLRKKKIIQRIRTGVVTVLLLHLITLSQIP